MNTKPIVIVLAVIIVGFIGYYLVATRFSNEGGSSAEVSVSVFDFDGNGCVGNDEDLAILSEKCPSNGEACNVEGETDSIQAALKFAEASKQYPCE